MDRIVRKTGIRLSYGAGKQPVFAVACWREHGNNV